MQVGDYKLLVVHFLENPNDTAEDSTPMVKEFHQMFNTELNPTEREDGFCENKETCTSIHDDPM